MGVSFARVAARVTLGIWTVATFAAGADMVAVWAHELDGVEQAVVAPMDLSMRLGLLAFFAIVPPLAVWALWRGCLRLALAIDRARDAQATPVR